MKIAIAGKGGSGKTTIAGMLARSMARRGHQVCAIDADTNPNLGLSLGVPRESLSQLQAMPHTIMRETTDEAGKPKRVLAMTPAQIARTYGVPTPDGVTLLLMGTIDHAGAGWMCRAHAAVRQLLAQIIAETSILTIVDMEAGLEHLSRGTDRHVDTLLVVTEPYYKALETARRCAELGQELGIPQVLCVANKFRSGDDLAAMRQYAAAHRLRIVGEVPFDSAISEADLEGRSPAHMLGMPAIDAVESLATALMGERPGAAIGEAR